MIAISKLRGLSVMKICVVMETYLSDSPENVVVVHCLVGGAREGEA